MKFIKEFLSSEYFPVFMVLQNLSVKLYCPSDKDNSGLGLIILMGLLSRQGKILFRVKDEKSGGNNVFSKTFNCESMFVYCDMKTRIILQ